MTPAELMARAMAEDETERTMQRLAGAATAAGADFHQWTEARLCSCTDNQHAEPEPGEADREWFWTADVAQVEAVRVFYSGSPHVRYRACMNITLDTPGRAS